jgi:glucose-6-phosphate isomerase
MSTLQADFVHPFSISLDLEVGLMNGATIHLVRRASDMRGHYLDAMALEKLIYDHHDPVHYEVYEMPVPNDCGHLMFCMSTLHSGMVGDEYFMTKGHYHQVVNTAEIYLCLRGEGFMLMKTPEGKCHAEKMTRGRMVYVPPRWAHRSVNIGTDRLTSFCVYPAEAGHNYGDIEREGFPLRIFNRHGQCVIE